MAITQAMVAEEVLSRQERAVIRGIYRASSLAEALKALESSYLAIQSSGVGNAGNTSVNEQSYKELKSFLVIAMHNALVSTKVPASVIAGKVVQSTPTA